MVNVSRRSCIGGVAALTLGGCAGRVRGGGEPPGPRSAIYDGEGQPATVADLVAAQVDADAVFFGELHDDPSCAAISLELLERLVALPRPVALAMEFFEADHQSDLDAYLRGEIDEPTFVARTKRSEGYAASHRPLVELCKAKGLAVIAANAPRRLVKGYRESGLDYDAYLASLSEADRALVPPWTRPPDDAHKQRFLATMGGDRGPRFWPSMALWNDAMAESMARHRSAHPDARVMLVVGAFHVAGGLGTVTAYRERRAEDRVAVVTAIAGTVAFAAGDRGEGDLVVKVAAEG